MLHLLLLHCTSDAAPAVAPIADKTFEFSGETTQMSKAAGYPRYQSFTRISASLDWERSVLSLHLLSFGLTNVHCGRIPSRCLEAYYGEIWHRLHFYKWLRSGLRGPESCQSTAWQPKGSRELPEHCMAA